MLCDTLSTNEGSDSDDSCSEHEQVVQRLDRRLRKLSFLYTNHVLHKLFRRFASAEGEADGRRRISMQQIVEMSSEVARKLDVPKGTFRDLPIIFERFDFDNDGLLDKRECARIYRSMMWQKRKDLGGRRIEVEVPSSTIESSGYTVDKELGRGGQGIMYLCSKHGSSKPFCVKFYEKANANEDDLDNIIEEYVMMKDFKSDHIAKTYEVFQDEQHYYLVNEVYFGGDLTKIAMQALERRVPMGERWWRRVFRQCLKGLSYLHSQAIMHCDIKEPNFMVADGESFQEPRIVLIDFGLSAAFSHTAKGIYGTPGYIPPETYAKGWWYPRGDVFSLGVMFFQLMIGQVPRDDKAVLGVLQADGLLVNIIKSTKKVMLPWERFPGSFPRLADLVDMMTLKDRQDRPSALEALEHEWFNSESDAKLPSKTLTGLLGTSFTNTAQDEVVAQLNAENNLDELRFLRSEMREGDACRPGSASTQRFVALLTLHGTSEDAAAALAHALRQEDGMWQYEKVVQESIEVKERYADNFLQYLFDEVDDAHSGMLQRSEIHALLGSDAFECPEHEIEDLIEEMDPNHNGMVALAEFRQAMLKDGRIARRSQESIKHWVCRSQSPCCHCS